MKCPICKKKVRRRAPEFPFCSERCRLLDLGNWAAGNYSISAPLPDTEESVPEGQPDSAPAPLRRPREQ